MCTLILDTRFQVNAIELMQESYTNFYNKKKKEIYTIVCIKDLVVIFEDLYEDRC